MSIIDLHDYAEHQRVERAESEERIHKFVLQNAVEAFIKAPVPSYQEHLNEAATAYAEATVELINAQHVLARLHEAAEANS
jgi:hypothetical protein